MKNYIKNLWNKIYSKITAKNVLISFIIGFIILFFTNGVPSVYSDGYCYYHIARSIVDQGSFVSVNKPEYYDYRGHVIAFSGGVYKDVCSPGAAIVNVPGLFITKQFRDTTQTIYNDYFLGLNGHTLADGTSILLTAMFFGIATVILLYKLSREYGASEKMSIFITTSIYLSTYAVWYVFLNAAYTHTYELFSIALLLWSFRKLEITSKKRYAIYAGLACGFGFLTRPLIIIPGMLFGVLLLFKKQWKNAIFYVIGNLPFWLLWFAYNFVSYGKIIASGYNEICTENFDFSMSNFHFFDVLFSAERGWYIYSPLFLIGTIGLLIALKKKRDRSLAIICITTIILIALIYGFWPAWWGGGSYGARFLILLAPFTIIGLYSLLKIKKAILRKLVILLIILSTLWSSSLTLLYRVTPVAELRPKSDRVGNMGAGDRYTPIDMYNYHFNLIKNSDNVSAYFKDLYKSFNGGNPYIIFPLGIADVVIRIDDRTQNELVLHYLNPPFKKQKDADSISLYLYYYPTKEVYSALIQNIDNEKDYIIDFNNNIISTTDSRINITKVENPPLTLSADEYTAIKPDELPISIFFHVAYNIQFKGPLIYKVPDAREFVLSKEY